MKINIIGTATTQFGELWDKSLEDLLREATFGALTDAKLEPKQIEAIFVANKAAGSYENQHHLNALVSQFFPHHPPAIRVEAACASGS
ncbi:MAG: thiolase domain-containing protein, partial [Candidatus Paceibacterota bacterium]